MSGPSQTRRVLILGGSPFQVPLIQYAKVQGDYVITADYLPGNPGHKLSDEYHNVSTTDVDAVVALGRALKIDAVMTFASDPALPAVAKTAEALGLHGTSVATVDILTRKDRFRKLLEHLALPCPKNVRISAGEITSSSVLASIKALRLPIVVKPTDASGSKGVRKLLDFDGLLDALDLALKESRCGECIVEEYIEGHQIHGDAFFREGTPCFSYFGDHEFVTANGVQVPFMTKWPSRAFTDSLAELERQLTLLAQASGYLAGPMNVEARIAESGAVYLIDISPRNGGNNVPLLLEALTGFNFRKAVYDLAVFGQSQIRGVANMRLSGAYYVLHSAQAGKLRKIEFSEAVKKRAIRFDCFKRVGDWVDSFTSHNRAIGSLSLEFASVEERDMILTDIASHVIVACEPNSVLSLENANQQSG